METLQLRTDSTRLILIKHLTNLQVFHHTLNIAILVFHPIHSRVENLKWNRKMKEENKTRYEYCVPVLSSSFYCSDASPYCRKGKSETITCPQRYVLTLLKAFALSCKILFL